MTKVFDPVKDIPNLGGKVIVVTGGNAGLGAEVTRKLAAHNPQRIYLCARTDSKAKSIISDIHERHPSVQIRPVIFDLASLQSVRDASSEIIRSTDRLDLLFLNAGISGAVPGLTRDGYERQFGVNHMSHALLAQLLLPLLLKTAKAGAQDTEPGSPSLTARVQNDVRIVTTSSKSAIVYIPKDGLTLKDCKTDMASFWSMQRYGQSKLANMLFAKKLAQLYPSITSISVHPGAVRTDIFGKEDHVGWLKIIGRPVLFLHGITVEEGAKTQLWAATSSQAKTGKFYFPVGKEHDGGKFGSDQKLADELWNWTEKELATHGGAGWPSSDEPHPSAMA